MMNSSLPRTINVLVIQSLLQYPRVSENTSSAVSPNLHIISIIEPHGAVPRRL